MTRHLTWQPDLTLSKGPVYVALSDQLARDVSAGRLVEGTRLPPQRALAWALGVTHGTVTRAYERAEKMGIVKAEVGRGTYVAPSKQPASPLMPPSENTPELDLARNFPFPHLDPDLGQAFSALSEETGINRLLNYTQIEGMLRHREAGQKLLELFGVEAPVEQILLTSGAQHALQILLQGLFRDGDVIAVEGLNYPGLISAAPRLGVRLLPIDRDEHGMCVDQLETLCRRRPVAGLVIAANVHNPTGQSTSPERLAALAECAKRHDLRVIEDDPYSALLEGEKSTFWRHAPERTCVVATASKLLGGGLRIGFICAPEAYRSALVRVINDISSMSSPIAAELVRHWVLSGQVETVLRAKQTCLKARHALVHKAFGAKAGLLPGRLSCWLQLPEGINPAVFELEAGRRGVGILGAHHFALPTVRVPEAARLAMAALPSEAQFAEAINRLADLINEIASNRG